MNKTEIPYFREVAGHDPYQWQARLFDAFVEGNIPKSVDIPTGLGKTLCVLLFLLARIQNPELPRRVIYIVDRRAIVDQTAEQIRLWVDKFTKISSLSTSFNRISAFPSSLPVQLGVLRGGLADDGEWRLDPARPSVVVGTVDMVGSRIMFSGYGDGRSRRSMHAGLLGHDSIVMLDEAHLSPPMEALIHTINQLQNHSKFQSMALSATNTESENVFRLLPEEESDPLVNNRLHAVKRPEFHSVKKPTERISRICELATKYQTGAIAIFTQKVVDAETIVNRLVKSIGTGGRERVSLLTGTLRGKERANLAMDVVWQSFSPSRERGKEGPSVFLVMTSAGEVGVDLDADHAIMDLSPIDSMIQRLGRVNRIGFTEAEVSVVHTEKEENGLQKPPKTHPQRLEDARTKTLAILKKQTNFSPASLREIDKQTLESCFSPSAKPARLHAEVVEAFAATSATLQLPPVSVYLRGVSDAPELPDSYLVWRRDTAKLVKLGNDVAKTVISFFRPHANEICRVPTQFAEKLVKEIFQRMPEDKLSLIVAQPGGDIEVVSLENEKNLPSFDHATVILPTTAGGLLVSGLPSAKATDEVTDVGDNDDRVRFINQNGGKDELPDWLDQAIKIEIPLHDTIDDNVNEVNEESYLVYALRRSDTSLQSSDSDLTMLGATNQTIDEHCTLVGDAACQIGLALALPSNEIHALETAGNWHDRGKARSIWQRAANIRTSGPPLAKSTKGRFRSEILGGYRHEFGSLVEAEKEIPVNMPDRDLVLHLIASHHGWARPGFPYPSQWDPDAFPELNQRLAINVADRFANLQSKYGPWRLAWLEALLKAADAYVSSRNLKVK